MADRKLPKNRVTLEVRPETVAEVARLRNSLKLRESGETRTSGPIKDLPDPTKEFDLILAEERRLQQFLLALLTFGLYGLVLRLTESPTLTNLCHFLLHFFVPRRDRQILERDLEEQFEEEASDPRLGLRQARLLYCKRVADNVLAYTLGRLPKRLQTIILSSITAAALKSLGLLPTLATLKDLGLLPWK